MSTENLIFYGERGIVNGLVLDIRKDLELGKVFLKTIDWFGLGETNWTENLEDITFLVEPGFSKFGQPDLVLICRLRDGSKRWLFIEVKAIPYQASAMKNSKGMSQKGFNSSINGQLSLNYRLAMALERYSGELLLEESPETFHQYQKALSDYNKGPRRACKPEFIKGIIGPHFKGLELDKCFFVVLSKDVGPNPMEKESEDLLPLLLNGDGKNTWGELSRNFGFLSLKRLDEDVLNFDGFFRRACCLHIGPWGKDPPLEDCVDRPLVKTANWKKFREDSVLLVDDLAGCIGKHIGSWGKSIRNNGSYSFKVKGKTIGKLFLVDPETPRLAVAFSIVVPNVTGYAESLGAPQVCVIGPSKECFLIVYEPDKEKICEIMGEFLNGFVTAKDWSSGK